MKAFIGFFVRRPLLVNLMLVLTLLVGIMVMKSQVYSAYPSLDLGYFNVVSFMPGAAAEDVELSITVPLEEELSKVNGISVMRSVSLEGISDIHIESNPNYSREDNRKFLNDIYTAIDRARGRLPKDLPAEPEVVEANPDNIPIMELVLYGDVSEELLRRTARQVQTMVRQLPGVASVRRDGYRKKEVKLLLDPQRMQQLSVAYNEIITAIEARNVRDAAGAIESRNTEQDVITVGQFSSLDEIEAVIVRSAGPGNYIRVRDIATVVEDYEDWITQSIANGKPGVSLMVRKELDANGLDVSSGLNAFIESYADSLPEGVKLTSFNDTSRYLRSMLKTLSDNAIAGMVLVFFVLMLFFPFRFTGWVVVGIPTAIMLAFIFMPWMGMSMNQTSLAALILMLGVLVDDAIVVSESIFRRAEMGEDPITAAINGTREMAPPVITSSATTVLAFSPLIFMSGAEGKFMWMMPAMVVLVLIASLIECKTMLPAHMAHALKMREKSGDKSELARTWFKPVEALYRRALNSMFQHRFVSFLGITFGAIIVGMISAQNLDFSLYPKDDVDAVDVKIELPVGTSFERTRELVVAMERELVASLDARDVLASKIGIGHHDTENDQLVQGRESSWAMLTVYFHSRNERVSGALELVDQIADFMKARTEIYHYRIEPQYNTPPTGRAIELDIVGNSDERIRLVEIIDHQLRQFPGVVGVGSSYRPGKDVVELRINHEALADYGLTVSDVVRGVRVVFDGLIFDELQTVDERVDFRMQFQQPEQGKLESLQGLSLINQRGETVLLRAVVDLETRASQANIDHYFGQRATKIYADIDTRVTSVAEVNAYILKRIDELGLRQEYADMQIIQGGELLRQQSSMGDVGSAGLIALAGIFMLLVLLFNSLSQPLLVVAVIPLGMLGVLFAFAVQGIPMSLSSIVGMTGLAGILVNDSLIMVDQINRRRGENEFVSRDQLIEAAMTRVRPIFMTTVTTVAGLTPAAYELLGGNPVITPIAMTMLWGVIVGSLVTLFYLPALYAIEQDVRGWLQRLRGKMRGEIREELEF